eukprot:3542219-Rhodomonas_salina.1
MTISTTHAPAPAALHTGPTAGYAVQRRPARIPAADRICPAPTSFSVPFAFGSRVLRFRVWFTTASGVLGSGQTSGRRFQRLRCGVRG